MSNSGKILSGLLALLLCTLLSLMSGPLWIAPHALFSALFYPDPLTASAIILHRSRLTRPLLAMGGSAVGTRNSGGTRASGGTEAWGGTGSPRR